MKETGRKVLVGMALLDPVCTIAVWWGFTTDIAAAKARVGLASLLIYTSCGPIEDQATGQGPVLLAVHGSGGGFDQGMVFAARLVATGVRVVAMSRFGYLRTPMPPDASAEAQADAFVCLMDAPGIDRAAVMGGSAEALSALQMTIRHPDRVSALILLVPLGHKPPGAAPSAEPMAPWAEATMMRVIGSDFLLWARLHIARARMIETVVATPSELVATTSPSDQARINAMLDTILPDSARAAGLRADTAAGKALTPAALNLVIGPTLIVSARDDHYCTLANAEYMAGQNKGAQFLGFETGGHAWVGHNDAVMAATTALVASTHADLAP